jgi:hypothetical protein
MRKETIMNLLQQWRDLYEEVIQFSETIARLPEECECGNAEAHLEERCPCCHGHTRASEPQGHGERCSDVIERLHADLALLCEDFKRTAGPLEKVPRGESGPDVRRGVLVAASDLEKILQALGRVGEAVVGFLRTCSVSDMRHVKRHSAALRAHCDQINAGLQGR